MEQVVGSGSNERVLVSVAVSAQAARRRRVRDRAECDRRARRSPTRRAGANQGAGSRSGGSVRKPKRSRSGWCSGSGTSLFSGSDSVRRSTGSPFARAPRARQRVAPAARQAHVPATAVPQETLIRYTADNACPDAALDLLERHADTKPVQPTLVNWLTVALIGGMVVAVILRLVIV